MADAKTIYDLILLLDLGAEDDRRAKIVADTRASIAAEGELLGDQGWGTRPLSYEIGHREAAEYHLLQFSGPASLIGALEHNLRITDGVIRYRVIKLPAGSTPVAASAPPAPGVAEPLAPAAAPASTHAAAETVTDKAAVGAAAADAPAEASAPADAPAEASAPADAQADAPAEASAPADAEASAEAPVPADDAADSGDAELVGA
jgi:small subunit ribosomal protein S6